MTRNGAIAARFAQAVTRRLAPHTGITQKMLARQAGGMSDDTLARYLADASTIPAAAVQACDAAFHHFKLPPGFLQEVMGGGAGEGPPTGGSAPVRLWGQQAGADLCFVATHEGSLHSAPLGPGAAVRQYVGLPAQSRADCVSLGLDQLGWVFAGLAQDCIALRFNTDLVAPRAADRAAAWLSLQGGARVEMLGETMPRAEAMTRLAAVAARRRAEECPTGWTSSALADPASLSLADQDLWRAWHEAAALRIPLLELAGRTGVTHRSALFLLEAGDAINAHLGAAMRVSPEVIGRSIHARLDQGYAEMVLHDLEAVALRPDQVHLHRITRAAGGSYTRMSLARRTGEARAQVMTVAIRIDAPADLVLR